MSERLFCITDRVRLTEIAVTFESVTKIKPVRNVPQPLLSSMKGADPFM